MSNKASNKARMLLFDDDVELIVAIVFCMMYFIFLGGYFSKVYLLIERIEKCFN